MAAVVLTSMPLAGCVAPAQNCSMVEPSIPSATTVGPAEPTAYSRAAVDYFVEIAFGAEFGSDSLEIHRWTENLKIAVHGDPNSADLRTLCEVVSDLNDLIGTVEVSVVGSGQNVDLYFIPEKDFGGLEPGYVPGNSGFFWTWWDATGSLTKAKVAVSTSIPDQAVRDHLIREEVTQALGLMQDSYDYPDSIFYQDRSEVVSYSDIDEAVIEILYLPEVTPGMTVGEALAVIPRG